MFRSSLLASLILATSTHAQATEFEFGGALEFEYADTRTHANGVTDDQDAAYVATAELGFGLKFNDNWRIDLVLLAEDIENTDEDDYRPVLQDTDDLPDKIHVEELVLTYSQGDTEASIGRFTLPFGDFETAVITDPQTVEIGETATSLGATISHSWGNVSGFASYFDGNLRSSAADENGFAAGLEWQVSDAVRVGGGYLSSQGAGDDAPELWNLYAAGEHGSWNWHAEYVGAVDEENGEEPQAWSLDVGYAINEQWSIGGRYQETDRSGVLDGGDGDYEEFAVAAAYQLFDNTTVGLEYADGDEGSSDIEQWLLQVAIEF